MKKYFPILSLLILLSSCNSQNDITPNQSNRMSGKYYWDVWKNNLTGTTLQINTCRRQNYIQFNSDGTFSRRGWDSNPCIQTEIDDGTYEYNIATAKITVRFTDGPGGAINTEVWNNILLTNNRISFTWDENLDGRDEYYLEYLKN
jgi:hypothetical protein